MFSGINIIFKFCFPKKNIIVLLACKILTKFSMSIVTVAILSRLLYFFKSDF